MYALSNLADGKEPSYRRVRADSALADDEVRVSVYQTGQVWDAEAVDLRFPNNAEKHAAAVAEQIVEIDAQRDKDLEAGVSYTFPDGSQGTVQSRSITDLLNLQGLVAQAQIMQSAGSTDSLEFRDAENVTHILTADEAVALGLAVTSAITAIYKQSWDAKDALRAG